jgi:hypothetical protein
MLGHSSTAITERVYTSVFETWSAKPQSQLPRW